MTDTLYSIEKLSASTDGKGIKVAATTLAGADTIHVAITGTNNWDLVTLEAINNDTVDRVLTICFGGLTAVDNEIPVTIPAKSGLVIVLDKRMLNNGNSVKAYASLTNVIVVYGRVDRVIKP